MIKPSTGNGAASGTRASVVRFGATVAAAAIGASSLLAGPAYAESTTMKLIEMMHANGSITDAQFAQLKAAASEEARQQSATAAATNTSSGASNGQLAHTNAGTDTGLPTTVDNDDQTAFRKHVQDQFDQLAWLDKIKLTGDLRLRYEYNSNNNALSNSLGGDDDRQNRSRGRLRYRLGVITNPIDNLEVGGGIASGGDDPRSTNQTFGDDFSSKPIRLDYAYAQYKFNDYITGIGGKFKFGNYLWAPTDLIWDGDINPEGASVHLHNDTGLGSTFVNSGVWVLQEFADSNDDPYLYYVQGGQHLSVNNFFASLAGTYYGYVNDDQPGVFNYSAGTNTPGAQFSVVDVNGEIGTKFSGGKASLIGEYVKNVHSDTGDDMGYAFGTKVGWDQWAMKYLYGDLERNAVPDSFPDSDRFNGATAMKGHEVAVSYALNGAVELGLDYYNTQSKLANEKQQLVQADVVLSF